MSVPNAANQTVSTKVRFYVLLKRGHLWSEHPEGKVLVSYYAAG